MGEAGHRGKNVLTFQLCHPERRRCYEGSLQVADRAPV